MSTEPVSLFSQTYHTNEERKKHDIRKYLLKTYMEKLKNEDDEITRLLNKVISADKIDSMSEGEIQDSIKMITVAQNILDDSFEYEHIFLTGKLFIQKVETILKKKYSRYFDVINVMAYNLKSTIERLNTIKNRHINKLVLITSMNLDRVQQHHLPNMKSIICTTLLKTIAISVIYGLIESFNQFEEGGEENEIAFKRIKTEPPPTPVEEEDDDVLFDIEHINNIK